MYRSLVPFFLLPSDWSAWQLLKVGLSAMSISWQIAWHCQAARIGRSKNTSTVTMPRVSARNHVIKTIQKDKFKQSEAVFYRYLLDLKDEIEDELDELVEVQYDAALSHRYFS